MISFELSDEQQQVREAMHGFAAQAMRPIARECDEESKLSEEFLGQSWELELISTQLSEDFGGGGEPRSPITNALILEELGWGDASLAVAAVTPAAFANAVADQGSEAQRREYLPRFCNGGYHAAALAINEPSPAFDVQRMRTTAEKSGAAWVLSGQKCFVPLGDRASHFLVLARVAGCIEAFIVPRDVEGLTVESPEKNLALRAVPTATLSFERVEVPAESRLGGAAGCDAQRLIDHARVALCAILVGLSRAALEYAVPYAKEREAFGQAIAQKQAIAFSLADMHIETESMRWLTWKAASHLEHGRVATRDAHIARAYAVEQSMWITDQGIQVLGGHGFIREHPVEMWFRNARTLGVLEGTVSV